MTAGCADTIRQYADSEHVALRDGSQVLVRQVRRTDAALLADGFARLSLFSRWARFLGPKRELTPAELRFLTDVDHYDHEAIGALSVAGQQGVGVARYVRSVEDPHSAEVAVTIVDEWQGRGLGTHLMCRLIGRARHNGIVRFTALAAADNVAVHALLSGLGLDLVRVSEEFGVVEYDIALDERRCEICGKPAVGDGPRRICRECIRAYLPRIVSQLDQPWWK
jgi:GNAT superfamily N-acetyltransferase